MEVFEGLVAEPMFGMVAEGRVRIHDKDACGGHECPFHGPSDHKMLDWPMLIRLDRCAMVERICPHGVGHPDPDSAAFLNGLQGTTVYSRHGCDGCCH